MWVCPDTMGARTTEPGLHTLPHSVCGHKHFVQPVGLHEAAYLLHGPFQAGHVLPVAPDEILSPQVHGEVGAPQRGAQLHLQRRDMLGGPGSWGGVQALPLRGGGGDSAPHSASHTLCVCLRDPQADRMFPKALE